MTCYFQCHNYDLPWDVLLAEMGFRVYPVTGGHFALFECFTPIVSVNIKMYSATMLSDIIKERWCFCSVNETILPRFSDLWGLTECSSWGRRGKQVRGFPPTRWKYDPVVTGPFIPAGIPSLANTPSENVCLPQPQECYIDRHRKHVNWQFREVNLWPAELTQAATQSPRVPWPRVTGVLHMWMLSS